MLRKAIVSTAALGGALLVLSLTPGHPLAAVQPQPSSMSGTVPHPAADELPSDATLTFLEPQVEMSHEGCHAQTTCSLGTTISCDAGSGKSCTTFSGEKVVCSSCQVSCEDVDAFDQCERDCNQAFFRCIIHCFTPACEQACTDEQESCLLLCGPAPATSCSDP